jgi:hypothetical protein
MSSIEDFLFAHIDYPILFCIMLAIGLSLLLLPLIWPFIRQHLEIMEMKGIDTIQLPKMKITAISEYILNESVWAWDSYARLNLWEIVKSSVASEMTRAGRDYQVRFMGTRTNDDIQSVIDTPYWQAASIDGDRIWDERNQFFTTERLGYAGSVRKYRLGSAPRIDVHRTWPRASILKKLFVIAYVNIKIAVFYPIRRVIFRILCCLGFRHS